jgi:hypothetical protein
MWRFLLSAVAAMAALIVLFASALDDVKSLPHPPGQVLATARGDAPDLGGQRDELASRDTASALTQQQPALEALQRQVADLQRQSAELQEQVLQRSQELEQRTHEITVARAEADELQAGVAALRQQRASLVASLAATSQHQKQAAATTWTAASLQTVHADFPHTAFRLASPGPAFSQAPPAATQPLEELLLTARQSLATGRPDEARRLLAMVQTQMVLRPVTPDRPSAEGVSVSATHVGYAIRWLDRGANGQAVQAIDRAVANVRADAARAQPPATYP